MHLKALFLRSHICLDFSGAWEKKKQESRQLSTCVHLMKPLQPYEQAAGSGSIASKLQSNVQVGSEEQVKTLPYKVFYCSYMDSNSSQPEKLLGL